MLLSDGVIAMMNEALCVVEGEREFVVEKERVLCQDTVPNLEPGLKRVES